jgi:hypothetical protein
MSLLSPVLRLLLPPLDDDPKPPLLLRPEFVEPLDEPAPIPPFVDELPSPSSP